jgi:hypothetical protein
MSHPSPCLHPVCGYKRSLKEEEGLLLFGLLNLGFWLLGALLWAFWCGKPLEEERENVEEGLAESLHQQL